MPRIGDVYLSRASGHESIIEDYDEDEGTYLVQCLCDNSCTQRDWVDLDDLELDGYEEFECDGYEESVKRKTRKPKPARKRGGLVDFIRKVEGRPKAEAKYPSWFAYDGGYTSASIIKEVLEDERPFADLYLAFTWRDTPQGGSYWSARVNGLEPLTDEDRLYCRWLTEQTVL